MSELLQYSLEEISQALAEERYPISGITRQGSAEFHFREPAGYLGVALHAGGRVRPDVLDAMDVELDDRFREEDPYTDQLVSDFPLQLIARDSRFEYDLNWEIEKSIYPAGHKKWGLQIWNRQLTNREVEITYNKFREFHALLDMLVKYILTWNNQAILFDVHSFCYRREKELLWWEDPRCEINLGTRSINRKYFTPLIDQFLAGVSGISLDGHTLRVAENEIFPGGYLTRKYAQSHNRQVLVLAIEYKKIFMDEWTGELYTSKLAKLKENLMLTKERMILSQI